MVKSSNITQLRPRRACPECGKPSTRAAFPFCSERCRSIDLNRWLKGAYVIPGEDADQSSPDEDQG